MDERSIEEQLKSMTLKMNRLEGEVDSLRKEVATLKKTKTVPSSSSISEKSHKPVYVPVEQRVPALAKAAPVESAPVESAPVTDLGVEPQIQHVVEQPKQVKEKTSMESKIGKNLMGIVAAVLIFAALIVFGGMIFLVIPDGVKVVIMYAISFAFAIVGIKKMDKESKYYTFFSSIAATGVSAVYITSLIAYFKFEIFPMPVMAAIIIIWLLATGILSKKKSKMFMYVCNVGLVISTFLAAFDWKAYYMAAIIYVLGLAFIYLLNRSESYNKDCHVFMQLPIVTLVLIVANTDNYIYIMVMFAIVTAVTFLREKLYEINKKNLATYIISSFLWIIYAMIFAKACEHQFNMGEYAFFIFVALFSAYTFMYHKVHGELSKTLSYVLYYLWAALFMLTNVGVFEEYVSFGIVAAAFIVVGCLTKKIHWTIPGYWYLLLFLFIRPTALYTRVVPSLIVLAACAALYIVNVKNYHIAFKYVNTTIFITALFVFCIAASFGIIPSFILFAGLSVFMNTNLYAKNYATGETEKVAVIVGYVMNFLMMSFALYLLERHKEPFEILDRQFLGEGFNFVIILLVALVLFSINTKRLFTNGLIPRELSAIYIGIKFTTFLITVLTRFEALSFVVSLSLLLFAVGCIVLGFKFKFKSLRIYGLVLTLITVIKILIADIEYDNFLLRPLGMLAAGLLCFGISFIYSRLEKQTKEEEDVEHSH